MKIPEQLRHERFTLLRGKIPFEKEWQEKNNHDVNSSKLRAHLKNGGNYGVLCGHNNLVVVDYDSDEAIKQYEHQLPSTFTVRTKKGKHAYYYLDEPINKIPIDDDDGNRLIDIQGQRSQVVGPGSTHPEGGQYEVIKDEPITKLTKQELLKIFPNTTKITPNNREIGKYELPKPEGLLDLAEVISLLGHNIKDGLNKCPFHPDKTPSFSVDYAKGSFNCFSCQARGNSPVTYVMLAKNCSKEEAITWLRNQTQPISQTKAESLAKKVIHNTRALSELMKNGVPSMSWIVQDLFPERGVVIIGAEAGSYKTYLAQYLSYAVSVGKDFLDYKTNQGTVLYVDEENGEASLMRRFEQLKDGHEFETYPDELLLTVFQDVKLDTVEGKEKLSALVKEYNPSLVLLDSMVRLMAGEENNSSDVRKVFETIKDLLEKNKLCFVFLHHTRKSGQARMDDLRGSGDFSAMVDVVHMIKRSGKRGVEWHMPKNRFIDVSQVDPFYVAVRGEGKEDSSVSFEITGAVNKNQSRVDNCLDDLKEWIIADKITSFRSGQTLDRMKPLGHSKNAVYGAINQGVDEEYFVKLKHGVYEVKKGRLVVEEINMGRLG